MIDELNPDSNAPVAGSRIEAASGDSPNIAAMAIPFDELKKNPNFENVVKVAQTIAKKRSEKLFVQVYIWIV